MSDDDNPQNQSSNQDQKEHQVQEHTKDDNQRNYSDKERKSIVSQNKSRAEALLNRFDLNNKQEKKLKNMVQDQVEQRKMVQYGSNSLPAGPDIYDASEVIVVEGRADVMNLMAMGIDNTIAVQGTKVPNNVIHLCNTKSVTALLDGDRGGDSILKELLLRTKIEYVARAPEGKEIEHLSMEEIMDILQNGKKPAIDAEFIRENISLRKFLKINNRWNTYTA